MTDDFLRFFSLVKEEKGFKNNKVNGIKLKKKIELILKF